MSFAPCVRRGPLSFCSRQRAPACARAMEHDHWQERLRAKVPLRGAGGPVPSGSARCSLPSSCFRGDKSGAGKRPWLSGPGTLSVCTWTAAKPVRLHVASAHTSIQLYTPGKSPTAGATTWSRSPSLTGQARSSRQKSAGPAGWILHPEKAASDDALRDNVNHGEAADAEITGRGRSVSSHRPGRQPAGASGRGWVLAGGCPPARPGRSSGKA